MLSRKFFLILISLLAISHLSYAIFQLYFPTFIKKSLPFSAEYFILLINSLFLIGFLLYYIYQKTSTSPYLYTDALLIKCIPNILCIKDHQGKWIHASSKYLDFLEIKGADYKEKTDEQLSLLPGSHTSEFNKNILLDKSAWQLEKTVKETRITERTSGETISIELTVTPVFEQQAPFRLIISGQSLQTNKQEFFDLQLLSNIFDYSHLGFAILDSDLKVIRINHAFSNLTGYSIEDIKTQQISFIKNGTNIAHMDATILATFKEENCQLWSGDISCQSSYGKKFIARLQINLIKTTDRKLTQYFATLIDISKNKLNEHRIIQSAHYDSLTGLPNRAMFLNRLTQSIAIAQEQELHLALFFIDLDKFKSINDSLGHEAGNEVLIETAKRIKAIVKADDIVARFSSDEFAILLIQKDSHTQINFTASLLAGNTIKSLSTVYQLSRELEAFIGASIGIAIYPEHGISSLSLLKNADTAMHEAKKKGRNNYQYFQHDFINSGDDKFTLESNLRKALENDELHLFYQPQFTARSRTLAGAEVLIRWFYDAKGENKMIPPDQFIPIAEESGLIIEIGAWILETACLQLKEWLEQGLPLQQVSVNVSALQFMDDGFLHSVEYALDKAQLAPKHLEIEITESMLIGDIDRIELQLKRLKKMGIKIALDDFGTGYSSLAYLKRFPIDVLKIDQSFVREMTADSKDASIVCAIIEMGHSLGQKIVAEGVENEHQLMFLSSQQCDIIQGYFFSRPLPVTEMSILLESIDASLAQS